MSGNKKRPPRGNAGSRAIQTQRLSNSSNTPPCHAPDFATVYVATRYRLPMPIAAVIARLAELGGALS